MFIVPNRNFDYGHERPLSLASDHTLDLVGIIRSGSLGIEKVPKASHQYDSYIQTPSSNYPGHKV